jgi:DNA-binding response OmpR family regulator
MVPTAPAAELDHDSCPPDIEIDLAVQERAVLAFLVANHGRVVSRSALARNAGMADLSHRRCDSVLVGLRRRLGPDAIITVRSRGWMIADSARSSAAALL